MPHFFYRMQCDVTKVTLCVLSRTVLKQYWPPKGVKLRPWPFQKTLGKTYCSWPIYQLCHTCPRTRQGPAGIMKESVGANRDKQDQEGTRLFVSVCPFLVLRVNVCPCWFSSLLMHIPTMSLVVFLIPVTSYLCLMIYRHCQTPNLPILPIPIFNLENLEGTLPA